MQRLGVIDQNPTVRMELANIAADVMANWVIETFEDIGGLSRAVADVWLINLYGDVAGWQAVHAAQARRSNQSHWIILHHKQLTPSVDGEWLVLPIKHHVLAAACKRVLSAFSDEEKPVGGFTFDRKKCALVDSVGNSTSLTDKESELLAFFMDREGDIIARADLLAQIWGYGKDISTHTLATHIYTLRQKLEIDASDPKIIISEVGGYRLNGSTT